MLPNLAKQKFRTRFLRLWHGLHKSWYSLEYGFISFGITLSKIRPEYSSANPVLHLVHLQPFFIINDFLRLIGIQIYSIFNRFRLLLKSCLARYTVLHLDIQRECTYVSTSYFDLILFIRLYWQFMLSRNHIVLVVIKRFYELKPNCRRLYLNLDGYHKSQY